MLKPDFGMVGTPVHRWCRRASSSLLERYVSCFLSAPVAQLDRAFASGAKGQWFESTRAYQYFQ